MAVCGYSSDSFKLVESRARELAERLTARAIQEGVSREAVVIDA